MDDQSAPELVVPGEHSAKYLQSSTAFHHAAALA